MFERVYGLLPGAFYLPLVPAGANCSQALAAAPDARSGVFRPYPCPWYPALPFVGWEALRRSSTVRQGFDTVRRTPVEVRTELVQDHYITARQRADWQSMNPRGE